MTFSSKSEMFELVCQQSIKQMVEPFQQAVPPSSLPKEEIHISTISNTVEMPA